MGLGMTDPDKLDKVILKLKEERVPHPDLEIIFVYPTTGPIVRLSPRGFSRDTVLSSVKLWVRKSAINPISMLFEMRCLKVPPAWKSKEFPLAISK